MFKQVLGAYIFFLYCVGISGVWDKAAGTWSWLFPDFPYRCLECGELGLQVTRTLCGECFNVVTTAFCFTMRTVVLYLRSSQRSQWMWHRVSGGSYRRSKEKCHCYCCIPWLMRTLKMETVLSSETSVNFNHSSNVEIHLQDCKMASCRRSKYFSSLYEKSKIIYVISVSASRSLERFWDVICCCNWTASWERISRVPMYVRVLWVRPVFNFFGWVIRIV
jgi:hypothetical protein